MMHQSLKFPTLPHSDYGLKIHDACALRQKRAASQTRNINIFRDNERLYPSRSIRLSNNWLSFGPENRYQLKETFSARMLKI